MAKLYAAEVAMEVTTKAVQLHGGYGYIKEYDVEEEAQIPILFSFVPNVKPGVPFSTIKAEISLLTLPRFSMVPVIAKMRYDRRYRIGTYIPLL